MTKHSDIIIVGTGAAGLFCALHLPNDKQITIITKEGIEESDSFPPFSCIVKCSISEKKQDLRQL